MGGVIQSAKRKLFTQNANKFDHLRRTQNMRAGFAEIEFTPAEGAIPGQIMPGYATDKLTPLMSHAAVVESNGVMAAIVSLDIIFFTTRFADSLRERISEATGIPAELIMLHTTHTHTGCETDVACWGAPANPDALIPVADATVEAVLAAKEALAPVKMGTARGFDTRYHFCRDWYTTDGRIVMNPGGMPRENLVRPVSDIDHSVNVIRFDDLVGNPLAFIVNYANHLDTTAKYKKFGADYAGYLRIALRRDFGRDVAVVFLNGCCGNINHCDYYNNSHKQRHCRKGLLASEQIGEGLAKVVKEVQPDLVCAEKEIFIQGKYEKFPVPRRHATPEMKEWAECVLKKADAAKAAGEKYNIHDEICAMQYLAEDPDAVPATVDIGIHVLQIGDTVYVGLPGEIFSEIGLKIKANSPFANTVVVELADGWEGYIPTDNALLAGCYESMYSNISYTGLGTADAIVAGATGMLRELYNNETEKLIGKMKTAADTCYRIK